MGTEVGSGQAGGPGDCKPFAGSVLAREPALCGTKAGSPLPTLPTDRRESRAGRSLWCFSTSLPVRKPSPKQPRKPPSRQRKKKKKMPSGFRELILPLQRRARYLSNGILSENKRCGQAVRLLLFFFLRDLSSYTSPDLCAERVGWSHQLRRLCACLVGFPLLCLHLEHFGICCWEREQNIYF